MAIRPGLAAERPRSVASVLAVAVAAGTLALTAAGCHSEAPYSNTSSSFQDVVHLTQANPVAVRHLSFEVTAPKTRINATLGITASQSLGGTTYEPLDGVTVSVRPDDSSALAASGSSMPGATLPSATFDLTKYCAAGCRSGMTVIVRGASHARPAEDIRVFAELGISGGVQEVGQLGTTLTIAGDVDPVFDGDPTALVTTAERAIEVSQASPTAHLELRLHVDPSVLTAPLDYPLVGSLSLHPVGQGESHDLLSQQGPIGSLTVNGQTAGMSGEGGTSDVDWLQFCSANEACDVTIQIDVTYKILSGMARVHTAVDNRSLAAPPSSFGLAMTVQARLEAFDQRALPAGSLTLSGE